MLDITFWKFVLVGIVNTLVGTGVMFAAYNLLHLSYWVSSASIDCRLDPVKFHTIDLLRTDHMHMRCPGKCPVIRIFLNIVMIAGNHDHLRMFQHLQYGIHFF